MCEACLWTPCQSGITTVNNCAHKHQRRANLLMLRSAHKSHRSARPLLLWLSAIDRENVLIDIDGINAMKRVEFGEDNSSQVSLGLCLRGPELEVGYGLPPFGGACRRLFSSSRLALRLIVHRQDLRIR